MGAVENGGVLDAFYRAIGWKKAGSRWERHGDGTSVASITGDGNGEAEVMGCGRFWRGRR
jgi:hypothetical protein